MFCSIVRYMSNNETMKRQADIFKALSNTHRLTLFDRLLKCCEPGTKCSTDTAVKCCVGDLGEGLDIAASTLSHHLKELNRVGLVQMERRGKNVDCWVDPAVLNDLKSFFN